MRMCTGSESGRFRIDLAILRTRALYDGARGLLNEKPTPGMRSLYSVGEMRRLAMPGEILDLKDFLGRNDYGISLVVYEITPGRSKWTEVGA